MEMTYKKINVELIVLADEADAVVAELSSAIDRLDEEHSIFGGDIETVTFQHRGTRRKSALMHTLKAGEKRRSVQSEAPVKPWPAHSGQ